MAGGPRPAALRGATRSGPRSAGPPSAATASSKRARAGEEGARSTPRGSRHRQLARANDPPANRRGTTASWSLRSPSAGVIALVPQRSRIRCASAAPAPSNSVVIIGPNGSSESTALWATRACIGLSRFRECERLAEARNDRHPLRLRQEGGAGHQPPGRFAGRRGCEHLERRSRSRLRLNARAAAVAMAARSDRSRAGLAGAEVRTQASPCAKRARSSASS
jgi:hypothetical protein